MSRLDREEREIMVRQINKSKLPIDVKNLLAKYIEKTLINKLNKHLAFGEDYNRCNPFRGNLAYVVCHINRLKSEVFNYCPSNLELTEEQKLDLIEQNQICSITRAIKYNLEYIPSPNKMTPMEFEDYLRLYHKAMIELLYNEYCFRERHDFMIRNSFKLLDIHKDSIEEIADILLKEHKKKISNKDEDLDYDCFDMSWQEDLELDFIEDDRKQEEIVEEIKKKFGIHFDELKEETDDIVINEKINETIKESNSIMDNN